MKFIVKVLYNLIIFWVSSILVISVLTTLPFILIYRAFIVVCAKFFRPDLNTIVSGIDIIFATDIGLWDTKAKELILGIITLKSELSFEKVRKYFEDATQETRNEKLCQYMVPWMGFGFWKREENFSVDNHIFVVDSKESKEVHDDKWLMEFSKILLKKPFGAMQSPWEFYIVHNYHPSAGCEKESAFVVRHHHSLLDGHSFIKLLSNAYDNYIPIQYEDLNRTINRSKMSHFKTRLLAPYTFLKYYLENSDWFRQPWNKYSGEMSIASVKISVEKLVSVKQKYKVGLNPIFFAGVTAALRKILLRSNSQIPQKIHLGCPFPKKNHPENLCNHFTALTIALPVGTADPVERLVSIDSEYERLTTSEIPQMFDLIQKIVVCLPYWFVHLVCKMRTSTVFSLLPIGAQNEFFGCSINEFHNAFSVPMSHTDSGIMIFGIMNNGTLHLRGTFDKSVLFTDEMAKDIMESINEYFDSLLIK